MTTLFNVKNHSCKQSQTKAMLHTTHVSICIIMYLVFRSIATPAFVPLFPKALGLLEWAATRISVYPDDDESERGSIAWDEGSQSLKVSEAIVSQLLARLVESDPSERNDVAEFLSGVLPSSLVAMRMVQHGASCTHCSLRSNIYASESEM